MKKWMIAALALVFLLGTAAADQTVYLPADSRLSVMLPDEMEYDGPGSLDKASFAYVSETLGLDVIFSYTDGSALRDLEDLIPEIEKSGMEDVTIRVVCGMDMIVYRYTPDDPTEMKCIGYIFRDGNQIQEIAFWYANQGAADLTKTIMESLTV